MHNYTPTFTDAAWYTLCMNNAVSDQPPTDAEMPPSAHHTSKQYETDCVPNVHDILHNVATQNPDPSSHRKRPFSGQSIPIMAHEGGDLTLL